MSIANLTHQSVILYPPASYSASGREVAGTGVTVTGRIVEKQKSRLLPNAQVQVIDAVFYIDGDATVDINYKLVYNSRNYKVHAVNKHRGISGAVHHTTCELIKYQL